MVKKWLGAAVLLTGICLQGCVGTEDEIVAYGVQAFDEGWLAGSDAKAPWKASGLKMIKGRSYSPWAATEDGCYELSKDMPGKLIYTDISAKKRSVLPVELTINYVSEDGTNWDVLAGEMPNLFVFDEQLYLTVQGNGHVPGSLYRIDPELGEHEKIVEFDDCLSFGNSVAGDETAMYMTYRRESGADALIKVFPEEKRVETLCEFSHTAVELCSAFDGCLMLEAWDSPAITDFSDYAKRRAQTSGTLYCYSLEEEDAKEVMQWEYSEKICGYKRQYVCVYEAKTDILKVVDVEKNRESVLSESFSEYGLKMEDMLELTDIGDNRVIIRGQMQNYIFDIAHMKLYKMKLPKGGMNPDIIAAYGDSYLISTGLIDPPDSNLEAFGRYVNQDKGMSRLALIKRENFWKQKYELEEIEDAFLYAD